MLGEDTIEKGTWKSKAIKESEEGFKPDSFGSIVLNSGTEDFDVFIVIDGQELELRISTTSSNPIGKEYSFRKKFSGNAFK